MYYQPNYYQPVTTTPQLYPSSSVSTQQQQQTVQNDGELIRVNGISGAYQCQLPANTKSIIVPDAEQSVVYLIKVNGLNREVFAYDITPHHEPEPAAAPIATSNTLEQTLQNLTTEISSMKEEINELKSNAGRTGSSDAAKPKYNKPGNGSNAASH